MTADGRTYGGMSATERRTDRRSRLLDAGLDLIGDVGVAELTVADVCSRAQLTKRYFYEEFGSLDAMVDAALDDAVGHLTAIVFTPDPADEDLPRDRLASFVHALTADPRLARLVLVETFGTGGALADRRRDLVHRAVALLLDDFLAPSHSGIADSKERTFMAYALSGATSEVLVAWLQGEIDATETEVVDRLAHLFTNPPNTSRDV